MQKVREAERERIAPKNLVAVERRIGRHEIVDPAGLDAVPGIEHQHDIGMRGLLGRGKSQVAYAKVALNIVNISTSEVVFSSQGAGDVSKPD